MILEIEVNGRIRTVEVERAVPHGTQFRVDVDGQVHQVDVCRVDATTISLIRLDAGVASHEVGVAEAGTPGELVIHLQGTAVRAVVNGRRFRRPAGDSASVIGGEQRIVAPMPGRVVRVMVEPGSEVAARQPLVVVEAMKMANELFSPKAGRVKEIAVREGMSVEAGRLLVVVE